MRVKRWQIYLSPLGQIHRAAAQTGSWQTASMRLPEGSSRNAA